jgi:hypothetical protein
MGARGINAAREIADIPRDFRAAQSGLTRIGAYDKPTYGAKLQNVAEDIGDVLARRQALRSEEGETSLPKVDYLRDLIVDPNAYAIKPKGGNWPTTLGSTEALSTQRNTGRRLAEAQYNQDNFDDIRDIFELQLYHYDKQNGTNLSREYVRNYLDEPEKGDTRLDRIKAFIFDINESLKQQDQPLLPSLDKIEKAIPTFNQWVMGPYQKYMRNEQATGLATDPLLAVINQAEIPLHSLFPSARERDYMDPDVAERYRQAAIKRFQKDETIDLTQPQYANVGKQTATTPIGKEYENYLDTDIGVLVSPLVLDKQRYPFVQKLNLDAPIFDVQYSIPEGKTGFKDIQNYVLEGLLSGKYNPEKISNLPPHVVVQDMLKDYQNKLKEEQRNQEAMQTYRKERVKQLQTVSDYPDGSKMVVFNKASYDADPQMLIRDFGQITKDLNQCIGAGCHGTPDYPGHGPALEPHTGRPPRGSTGALSYQSYYDMVKDDRGEIVSLVDPDAKYQFTIQIKYEKYALSQKEQETIAESWITQNAPNYLDAFLGLKNDVGGGTALSSAMRAYPEIKQIITDQNKANFRKNITQMRGADNGNVAPEYEDHVFEWLNDNADQLDGIDDLDQIPGILDLNRSTSYLTDKVTEYGIAYDIDTVENFIDKLKEENALPRFFYPGDVESIANDRGVDLTQPPLKELSPFDRQTVLDEFDRYILNQLDSLYAQDNLQDKFVNDINLLIGNPIRYDLPIDMHRKLVKMILSDNYSLINSVADQLRSYVMKNAVAGGLEIPKPFGLTDSQATAMFNILNNWYNKHPRKEEQGIWAGYEKDTEDHPNPFDEVKLKEQLIRPSNADLIERDLRLWIEDNMRPGMYDVPQVNEDILILMGSANPEAKIPTQMHMKLVKALLNQDDNARQIRNSLARLQDGEEVPGLTKPQLDNIQTMLEKWVERYPLAD